MMKKRFLISLAVSIGVYFGCYTFGDHNRPLSNYDQPDMQSHLRHFHNYIDHYKKVEGTLPDEKLLNEIITKCYPTKPVLEIYENTDLEDSILLYIPQEISSARELHYWKSPPIFTIEKTLPSGFGFYLNGEDGISKTSGNDPDDINSWDKKSWLYYYYRVHQKETKSITTFSIIAATLAFLIIMFPQRQKK